MRATGFAELDRVLRDKASTVVVPANECVAVTLVVSHFECEVEASAL